MRRAAAARVLVIFMVPVTALVIVRFGLNDRLDWATLVRDRNVVVALVAAHPGLAAGAYIALYASSIVVCLPVGALMIVAGGLFFGPWWGAALASVGATIGAAGAFLFARGVLGRRLLERAARSAAIARVRPRLARDGVWFLIALRLVPLLPFALVNVAPVLVGMRFWPYLLASVVGIVPTSLVLASAGVAVVAVLGEQSSGASLMSWRVLWPLPVLSALALLPVILRGWRPVPCAADAEVTGCGDVSVSPRAERSARSRA